MKLKGILEFSLGGFLTFRGFAPLKEITRISKADENYQRDLIEEHVKDLQNFIEKGENLFFPEIILGYYIPEVDDEIERLERFFMGCVNNEKGNFGFRKFNIGIQTPKPYGEIAFRVATLSTLREKNDENIFFRIDGNHRLKAIDEIGEEDLKNKITPIAIIFFRTKDEYKKQSKMIFHNINFKMIPISMEENLKLIFEDEENFSDKTLQKDPSFGMAYYRTKEVSKFDFSYFPNLNEIFKGHFREETLNFFKISNKRTQDLTAEKIKEHLSTINEIYKHESLKESDNPTLFYAFLYYSLEENTKKIELFTQWVLKNHIYKAKMNLKSLLNIFDEIYKSGIKNIFVAMAFARENCDNVWESIVSVYDKLIKDGYELDKSLEQDNKFIPYRVDKENSHSKDIIEKIKNGIKNCDLMIADLTHGSHNVYYEIGLALGQNKPIILLFDKKFKNANPVKFDLFTMERLEYNSDNMKNFERDLENKLIKIFKNMFL